MMYVLTTTIVLVGMAGCSPYKAQFNCPVPDGMPCTSMSRINQLIDEGALPLKELASKACKGCTKRSASAPYQWVEAVIVGGNTSLPHQRFVLDVTSCDGGGSC